MLAKITAIGQTEYFEVEIRNGQIILTPMRILRSDSVRAKLAELNLQDQDLADAVAWARQALTTKSSAEQLIKNYK